MVPRLGPTDPMPRPETALREPNGLLAAGGGLSVPRLVDAYRRGVFPWFSDGEPVLWWCPDPRLILPTDAVHVSRSLTRRLARRDYRVTIDAAFGDVMRACAEPRAGDHGTWISPAMVAAYDALRRAGHAHSLEVWHGEALVGGVYGVAIGTAFFGESMFSRATDGSKIALVWLAAQLARWGVPFIDCQVRSAHLVAMGAVEVPRSEFLRHLAPLVAAPELPPWRLDVDLRGPAGSAAARVSPAGSGTTRTQTR
jgi:leucyl/phenylalanyl-tRNA---protein transferase